MPTHDARFYQKGTVVIASVHDDGMHVELQAGNDGPLVATFRAPREGEIHVVLQSHQGLIELPLETLEQAIRTAREEVHAEPFYP